MTVLFFIVLPLATILIAIVLQKLLRSPILVALLVFAVYLILAFTVFETEFLINAIIYTIIAFITAIIFRLICCLIRRLDCNENNGMCMDCDSNEDTDLQQDIAGLQNSIRGLERTIDSLEDNITTLTDILSNLGNNSNNNCGCNRGLRR